jgi:hypothetical protein
VNFLSYLWKSRSTKWQIVLTIILAVLFVALVLRSLAQSRSFNEIWQGWMDPFLAVSTVTVAIFIWINEKRQDWENALPKKLDVHFVLGGEAFYRVENAPLASDDDIRQWGQQIGQQMNDNERLAFNGFKLAGPHRERDSAGNHIMRYHLTVWLHDIGRDKKKKIWQYDDDGRLVAPGVSECSKSCPR